jgi:hypothetical protein
MAKILQTRLPLSTEENVTSDTFNRTIRVLELNLNAVDVDNTPQFNQTFIDESKFIDGDVIWNTSLQKLQVFSGGSFKTISYPAPTLLATASAGSVQVIANGSIVVEVG